MNQHPHQHYIEGIRQRETKVIKVIYSQFFPAIVRYIKKNKGTKEDAYDVFQEAMKVLFQKATTEDFEIQTGLNNWLFMVCRNIWLKKLNKRLKIPVTFEAELGLTTKEDVEQLIIKNEEKQLYLKHFKRLSEKCQQVMLLFFDKIKMVDIAKKVGYKNDKVAKKKKAACQKKLVQLIQADPLFKELSA